MKYQERIGERYGCFEITAVTNERGNDGNLLYEFTCTECGYRHKRAYKKRTEFSDKCTHLTLRNCYRNYGVKDKWVSTRLRKIYEDMVSRCYNPDNKDYRWYGARGVKLCDEWFKNPREFEHWAKNSGYEEDLTIDRVDSNGDYSPENCRWVTRSENSRRAGKVNWITVDAETLTGRQWAEKLGVSNCTVNRWLREKGLDKTQEIIRNKLRGQL